MLYIWESKSRLDAKGLPLLIAAEGYSIAKAKEIIEESYYVKRASASFDGNDRLFAMLTEELKDARNSMTGAPRRAEFHK